MSTEMLLLKAVDYTIKLLTGRETRSEKEKVLQQEFIHSFREALIQTRVYLADRRDEVIERDRKREETLSLAWNKVGLCGRKLDPMDDFYVIYFEKSDYWADPSEWKLYNSDEIDISLKRAEEKAKSFEVG
jgi:hypothetical protein